MRSTTVGFDYISDINDENINKVPINGIIVLILFYSSVSGRVIITDG